ncbi:MAG: pyridoxamine 5'-phosphate oxidase family protein [Planctomycetes bacterium]|nr:pyridoxamine 5'-phosphate oxidase family protein [Planctomycetota bacterium]
MRIDNPFHEGEIQVQKRAGEFAEAQRNGRMLADSIMRGAMTFVAQQPMVILGSVDEGKDLWASVLFGPPGFVRATDERRLEFDLSHAAFNEHDPFWENIQHNPRVGALLIELATRRRLRINGTVARPVSDRLTLDVAESYPNCPKYIQRRQIQFEAVDRSERVLAATDGNLLKGEQAALIEASDTFFVASAHPQRGVDVSHRGGLPGFVEVLDKETLRIPDYVGNSMFNTLGNFMANPHAGLLFLDFEGSRTLQLTGRAEILWDREDPVGRTGGTRRFWTLRIDRWRESAIHAGLRWEFVDYSPHHPQPS